MSITKLFLTRSHTENALNPMVFPSLRRFKTEVVAMAAHMLHGDGAVVGNVTSGGTESILMAVKTYRDRARSLFPHITQPEMVSRLTSFPSFCLGFEDLVFLRVILLCLKSFYHVYILLGS